MRTTFAILLAFFLLVTSASSVPQAQSDVPFYWEFINVDIDVQENGDMLITETQKYVFSGPSTNERFRWIPLDKVDGIVDVEVSENGELLSTTTGIEDDQLWIRWSHELNPPESHTFVLKYRVLGGLHIHDDGDQVYWKALFKDRVAPIIRGKVTVHLPNSLSNQISDFRAFGVPAVKAKVNSRTVEFSPIRGLPRDSELEVQVTFTHGILDIPTPGWQSRGKPCVAG